MAWVVAYGWVCSSSWPSRRAQQSVAVLHGAGEDVVTADQGGADQRLRSGRWGLAGDEPGQPFPPDGFGGSPRLVVVDHPPPLDSFRFAGCVVVALLRPGGGGGWSVGVAGLEPGGLGVGADPHRSHHRDRIGGAVGVSVGVLVLLLPVRVVPFGDDHDGGAVDGGPVSFGHRCLVGGDELVEAQRPPVGGQVGGVERGQPFTAESGGFGGELGGFGGCVPQPLRDVLEGLVPGHGLGEPLDCLLVVFEFGEDRRLFQGESVGVHPGFRGWAADDGDGGVDGGPLQRGPFGDLGGADPAQGELFDAVADLLLGHRGPVHVLGHLVGDPVRIVRGGHHAHRHRPGRGADLGGDDRPPLPADHDQRAVVGPIGGDHLHHTTGLDRRLELPRIRMGVGAHIRTDHQRSWIHLEQFLHRYRHADLLLEK